VREFAVGCMSGNRVFMGTGTALGGNIYSDWWEFTPGINGINNVGNENNFNVVFNSVNKEIVVRNTTGKGVLNIYSLDGKLLLEDRIISESQIIPWSSTGVFMVTLNDNGKRSTIKVACNN
jgi:hypothetical protein